MERSICYYGHMITLKSKIPDLLKARGITYPVAYIRRMAKVSRPTAQMIVRGRVYFSSTTLEKLAEGLGIKSIVELLEFEFTDESDENIPDLLNYEH